MQQGLTLASSTCKAFTVARSCNYCQSYACKGRTTVRQLHRCMSASHKTSPSSPATVQGTESAALLAPAAEDLVQYIVLRKDLWNSLEWPLGSIIAQACHASTAALWLSKDSAETSVYCSAEKLDHMHKVSTACSTPLTALSNQSNHDGCEGGAGSQRRAAARKLVK